MADDHYEDINNEDETDEFSDWDDWEDDEFYYDDEY